MIHVLVSHLLLRGSLPFLWGPFFSLRISPRSDLRTDLTQSKLLTSNYGCNILLAILKDQRFLYLRY